MVVHGTDDSRNGNLGVFSNDCEQSRFCIDVADRDVVVGSVGFEDVVLGTVGRLDDEVIDGGDAVLGESGRLELPRRPDEFDHPFDLQTGERPGRTVV